MSDNTLPHVEQRWSVCIERLRKPHIRQLNDTRMFRFILLPPFFLSFFLFSFFLSFFFFISHLFLCLFVSYIRCFLYYLFSNTAEPDGDTCNSDCPPFYEKESLFHFIFFQFYFVLFVYFLFLLPYYNVKMAHALRLHARTGLLLTTATTAGRWTIRRMRRNGADIY
jgi:hypothetical protein